MRNNLPGISLLSMLCGILLQGCFTGIESTPKITAHDVERSGVTVTHEQRIASSLVPATPAEWLPGRLLRVTDSRFAMLLDGHPDIPAGDVVRFTGISQRQSFTADTISVVNFINARTNQTLSLPLEYNIASPGAPAIKIPFTVDLQLVADADARLRGTKVYLLSRLRVDSLNTPAPNGPRYIAATIDSIVAGTDIYPLTAVVTDELGNHSRLAMTAGNDVASTRNFDDLFVLTNPRLRYSEIPDADWLLITRGEVAEGMTTQECRLALGSPRDVVKSHNGGSFFERWTFDNGAYLIFTDGRLSSFRL